MDNNQTLLKTVDLREIPATIVWLLFFSLLFIGCETTKGPAPVVERAVVPERTVNIPAASEQVGQFYIVQRGDTLYGIALKHGVSQKDLAEWNNIVDPHSIRPGQRINLSLSSSSTGPTLFAVPQQSTMPIVDPTLDLTGRAVDSTHYSMPHELASEKIKISPKALKLPYSEQNVARIQHSINPPLSAPGLEQTAAAGSGTRIENAPAPQEQKIDLVMRAQVTDWIWPTNGRLLSSFSANSKGLKISGQIGQDIVATAAGEVVYSGDGLRGYGNLIIIKHNDALLSAYAHNSKLLVKEGETVTQGQKIAEMGNTDTDTPQLHFEIRRHGKPVDPLEFLPGNPG
ncbi:MAG: peptidoglycan DD-metalloendopeptidase family protein [Nitrosomonas sp.]|nr:peptidoglycan DD-metalloendopeptidase family protein [Nitrosomonas sp.]MCW5608575.1 peptidoglycan DD-metalloendopeptidase family protein [Nitrosomonas sp.]